MQTISDGSIYRGAQAAISIHSVDVRNNQYTKSQIWVENGLRGQVNSIQFGWSVSCYIILLYLVSYPYEFNEKFIQT